ncbi:Rrf2 family transcriptional regulator [Candidatus Roizmanbacteria bacterium]|nr:Rrf2 family transcriptional regulator [Candidatus Roizmanbacteria bacterium]
MLTLSNKTDYSLILLGFLAEADGYVSMHQLIEQTKLPRRFLARIASELVSHGILESKEGKTGGYKLKKQLSETRLVDVIEVFENNTSLLRCNKKDNCQYKHICKHHCAINETLTTIIRTELQKWTLDRVFKSDSTKL